MSGRYRMVALQAVGVAVIAAIIFAAFLRPEDPESLSGIEAPGGDEESIVDATPPDEPRKKQKPSNLGGPRGGVLGATQGAAPSGPQERLAPGVPGATGTGGDQSFDGEDTPPGDQYDDLVTRLLLRVDEPSVLRGIEPAP